MPQLFEKSLLNLSIDSLIHVVSEYAGFSRNHTRNVLESPDIQSSSQHHRQRDLGPVPTKHHLPNFQGQSPGSKITGAKPSKGVEHHKKAQVSGQASTKQNSQQLSQSHVIQ